MKKQTVRFILLAAIIALSANFVAAQNPHFVAGPTLTDNGTTLTTTGSIAGLGNNQLIVIALNVTATVTTTCTHPGGNVAPGQTKTVTLTKSGKFMSDQNGRVNFTITTPLPTPGQCPNGQWTGTISDISFSNVSLSVNGQVIYTQ